MSILVFGSLNMDLVTQVSRLPEPGETLLGDRFLIVPGGKGANQAVAAARLGVSTAMVGRVGGDSFGEDLLKSLNAAGVNTVDVSIDGDNRTGVAAIAVAANGENHIIVVPGANTAIDDTDIERLSARFQHVQVLLLQFEIPLPMVQRAAQLAQTQGIKVIVDPAPAQSALPDEFYRSIDILTPNQSEAAQLVGFPVDTPESALAAAQHLRSRGVKTVIVKLGGQGCVCSSPEGSFLLPAYKVDAVDTVAAGDAFNGGLAAALCQDQALLQAMLQGSAVAALSVTQAGAQSSLPTRDRVTAFLAETPLPQPVLLTPAPSPQDTDRQH
ncbi:MAG: ribokinase [Cyanobacteria bacterium P01_A01_bin.123]